MKRTVLFLGLMFSVPFFGQFKLTPNNFVSEENPDKNYIVIDVPNVNQKELFDKVKIYITSKYKGVKNDGYNEVEGKQIVIDVSDDAGTIKRLGIPVIGGDFLNRYEINFKDEKIMVKPSFSYIKLPNGTGGLTEKKAYNSKGKMTLNQIHFDGINKKTNKFISDLKNELNKNEDW